MNTRLGFLVAALSCLLAGQASSQTVRTVVRNGPSSELYDVVILGDGYRAVEEARFHADVQQVVDGFRNDPTKFPYGAYFHTYNFHSVFRASAESGASKPPQNIFVNNAYGARYWTGGTERCLYITNTAQAAADAALAPDSDGRIIVLVNDSKYGGCAGVYSVSYNGPLMWEVQAHEWGHSFAALADEYDYGNTGTYTGPEPREPNVTRSSTGTKWSLWLGIPGQYSLVGAFEGARYWPLGIFRPELDCLMRALNRRFCTICREEFIKNFNRRTAMIGEPLPAAASVDALQHSTLDLSFTNRLATRPHAIAWRTGSGPWEPGGERLVQELGNSATGPRQVSVRLQDTSAQVRNDPSAWTTHTRTWTVNVLPATPGAAVPRARSAVRGTEATTAPMAGPGNPTTYMLGITAAELAGIPAGSVLTGLSLRAAVTQANPVEWPPAQAGFADYEVTIGEAEPLASWTPAFAGNFRGTPVAVRTGPMVVEQGAFPNDPSLPGAAANSWGGFYLDFHEPYTYTGGDLALLITHSGSDVAGAVLLLDAVSSNASGHGRALSAPAFRASTATNALASFVVARLHYGRGTGCRGTAGRMPHLVLGGDRPGGDVVFAVTGGAPGTPVLTSFGIDDLDLPLPGGCTLRTTPVVLVPATLSAQGRASLSLGIPQGIEGTVRAQVFVIDTGAPAGFTATNAVRLTLVP